MCIYNVLQLPSRVPVCICVLERKKEQASATWAPIIGPKV